MLMRPNQYETAYAPLAESRTDTSLLSRAIRRIEEYAEYRRQRTDLLSLDNHILKDIGLSRADAVRLAGRPFKWF
jgi:uncharacterized protein YjiS (DUF1127 family)